MSDVMADQLSSAETAPTGRRQHILQAATACFARSGFHGTSMQEICQAAGMSPGAVYRYFRSKDDIIAAIADEERGRNLTRLTEARPEGDFIDYLVRLGLGFLAEMTEPGRAALMAEVFAEGLRNPAAAARFKMNAEDCTDVVRTLIAQAVAAGEIAPPADVDFAISALMATTEGLVMRMSFDPGLTVARMEPLLRLVAEGLFRPAAGVGRGTA